MTNQRLSDLQYLPNEIEWYRQHLEDPDLPDELAVIYRQRIPVLQRLADECLESIQSAPEYVQRLMIYRYVHGNSWRTVGALCGLSADNARQTVYRYLHTTEK